jgi:cytochrome c5
VGESAEAQVAESDTLTAETMAQWARSCALCHVRGEGGAPVLGDTESWADRLDQGEEVLLTHTLEGYNNMPPLGYCMDCEEVDFRAISAIRSGSGR